MIERLSIMYVSIHSHMHIYAYKKLAIFSVLRYCNSPGKSIYNKIININIGKNSI